MDIIHDEPGNMFLSDHPCWIAQEENRTIKEIKVPTFIGWVIRSKIADGASDKWAKYHPFFFWRGMPGVTVGQQKMSFVFIALPCLPGITSQMVRNPRDYTFIQVQKFHVSHHHDSLYSERVWLVGICSLGHEKSFVEATHGKMMSPAAMTITKKLTQRKYLPFCHSLTNVCAWCMV